MPPLGSCCLGNLCFAASQNRVIEDYVKSNSNLPYSLARFLNIMPQGRFTKEGAALVKEFVKVSGKGRVPPYMPPYSDLIDLNDFSDLNHAQIGEVIELLFANNGFEEYNG